MGRSTGVGFCLEGNAGQRCVGNATAAAAHGMEYLLTWNFKHIANATMRTNVELVCRLNDFEPPIICTPLELMEI